MNKKLSTNPTRAAAYVRSALFCEHELKRRKEETLELAKSHGLTIADSDVYMEGGRINNIGPQMSILLEAIRKGEISTVVCLSYHTLMRSDDSRLEIIKTFAASKVKLIMNGRILDFGCEETVVEHSKLIDRAEQRKVDRRRHSEYLRKFNTLKTP